MQIDLPHCLNPIRLNEETQGSSLYFFGGVLVYDTACIYRSLHSLCVGRGGLAVRVRASNEGSPRPRVARAQGIARPPCFPYIPTSLFPVLKGVAKAALYCARPTSTFLSCAFCEQGRHLAAPYPPLQLNWSHVSHCLIAQNTASLSFFNVMFSESRMAASFLSRS